MKESYGEGVANHPGPELCQGVRKGALEALDRGICRLGIELRNLVAAEGTETLRVERATENPAANQQVMEAVCEGGNLREALQRVKANKGSPGIDGMTLEQLPEYLKQHWPAIREQLLSGTCKPQPVKRVEIRKPDGGVRKLGIPTVVDRFVQQAVQQVLQKQWDPTFSEHSCGSRPNRSAQQAVARAQQYIAEGCTRSEHGGDA